MLNIQRFPKVLPNALDILIFAFVVASIIVSNVYVHYLLIAIPCTYMLIAVGRQIYDCIKEKAIYSLTMLYSAVQMKQGFLNRATRDIIIYSLHIYLFTFNHDIIYLVSFGSCLIYDLFIYNLVLNPFMKKYVMKRAGRTVKE